MQKHQAAVALRISRALERLQQIHGFEKVQFVILYGSAASGQMRAGSDIDLCIYYEGSPDEARRFRFQALSELADDAYDIQIFQQLPLYVRKDVLRGTVLFCRDSRFLYDTALTTIREYDAFRHRLLDYIGEEAIS
jgi:uncharacterized protein